MVHLSQPLWHLLPWHRLVRRLQQRPHLWLPLPKPSALPALVVPQLPEVQHLVPEDPLAPLVLPVLRDLRLAVELGHVMSMF